MHIQKPNTAALSFRPIEYRSKAGLCLSTMLFVPMSESISLLREQSMWDCVSKLMAVPLIDEGVAKLTPEFLVVGRVHAADPKARGAVARVRLGTAAKSVLAFSPRHWDGDRVVQSETYRPVALDWANAYGGPGFADNMQGMGAAPVGGVHLLPLLELPDSRISAPGDVVRPAGFGALDLMHPQRAALRGTYDDSYLKTHAPGFPPDVDWRHFNMAPRDQWLDAPLRGDEAFALENMHPARPLLQGKLPGLKVRVFANYRLPPEQAAAHADAHKLKEVPMRLTTVWFFPEVERMVLVWHGLAEVAEYDGTDIAHLMCAVERVGEPRGDTHYAEVLAKRLDPVHGGIESLNDADLLPEGIDTTDPDFEQASAVFKMDGLQGDAQFRRAEIDVALAREKVIASGKDPDAMGLKAPVREKPPSMGELPAYIKAKQKEADQQHWAAVDDMVTQLEKVLRFEDEHQVKLADLVHRGPPLYNADAHLAELKAQGGRLPMPEAQLLARLRQKEGAERLGYLQSAHMQPPAHPLKGEQGAARRQEAQWLAEHGHRTLPCIDLTGVDLSGLDLSGFDFSGAWLESTNLRGANISACNFTGAVLAHADMRDCVAVASDFTGANLGRAKLAGAVFDRANLGGAMLMHTAMAKTQMRHASLAGANLLETTWGSADWGCAQLAGAVFYKLDLQGLDLREADLSGASFIECDVRGVDLSGARLQSASFVTCMLQGVRMVGAQARGVVFTKGTVLDGLDAGGADMSGANLGECSAVRLRAPRATLDAANLGMADLQGADLRLASAKGTLFRKARCTRARMAGTNCQDAIFSNADLIGADFRKANLFAADLTRVALSGDTQFEGALITRARTWPRLTPEQQALAAARGEARSGGAP
ncbi:DUF2169 family type VI secretion system accessory protein [Variovorax atrisoli]|uniref:DUF2169 family type VI secretion system accessory protein n=1 Tax=Variovorax atrisoli TaxID=3394203 RepID=UPI00339997DA